MIPAELLALLFTHARRTPMNRQRSQQFRADVPAISPPPDRDTWTNTHGEKPWSVGQRTHRTFQQARLRIAAHRARRCIERDLTTIDRDKAIGESVKLEHICEQVKTAFGIKHSQIFFDPSDGQFWVYPHGWARHESVTR